MEIAASSGLRSIYALIPYILFSRSLLIDLMSPSNFRICQASVISSVSTILQKDLNCVLFATSSSFPILKKSFFSCLTYSNLSSFSVSRHSLIACKSYFSSCSNSSLYMPSDIIFPLHLVAEADFLEAVTAFLKSSEPWQTKFASRSKTASSSLFTSSESRIAFLYYSFYDLMGLTTSLLYIASE